MGVGDSDGEFEFINKLSHIYSFIYDLASIMSCFSSRFLFSFPVPLLLLGKNTNYSFSFLLSSFLSRILPNLSAIEFIFFSFPYKSFLSSLCLLLFPFSIFFIPFFSFYRVCLFIIIIHFSLFFSLIFLISVHFFLT